MTVKLRDSRGVVAAIRHDVKAGNIERARRWAGELFEGRWSEASPAAIEQACTAVESKLDEMGM